MRVIILCLTILLSSNLRSQEVQFNYKDVKTYCGKVNIDWYFVDKNGHETLLSNSTTNTIKCSLEDRAYIVARYSKLSLGYDKNCSLKKKRGQQHKEFFILKIPSDRSLRPSQFEGLNLIDLGSDIIYDENSNSSPKTMEVKYVIEPSQSEMTTRVFTKAFPVPIQADREIKNRDLTGPSSEIKIKILPDEAILIQKDLAQKVEARIRNIREFGLQNSIFDLQDFINTYKHQRAFDNYVREVENLIEDIKHQESTKEILKTDVEIKAEIEKQISLYKDGLAFKTAENYEEECFVGKRQNCKILEYIKYILIIYNTNKSIQKKRIDEFRKLFPYSKYNQEISAAGFDKNKDFSNKGSGTRESYNYTDEPNIDRNNFEENEPIDLFIEEVRYGYEGTLIYIESEDILTLNLETDDPDINSKFVLRITHLSSNEFQTLRIAKNRQKMDLKDNPELGDLKTGYYKIELFDTNDKLLDEVEELKIENSIFKIPPSIKVAFALFLCYCLYWSYNKFIKL